MKRFLLLFVFMFSISLVAQENYKYVIVPKQFSFFKEANKFNLNALTKSFFESEGFEVFYETDTLPQDLAGNRCLALVADVEENNKLFVTNLNVVVKDCMNKVVFESLKGSSREKEHQKAYTIALREALTSMKGMLKIKNDFVKSVNEVKQEVVEVTPSVKSNEVTNPNQLFAIPTETGFKLVDSQPTTIMVIHKTTVSTVFIAEKGAEKGVLVKKINGWYFEFYSNGQLNSEKLSVKF